MSIASNGLSEFVEEYTGFFHTLEEDYRELFEGYHPEIFVRVPLSMDYEILGQDVGKPSFIDFIVHKKFDTTGNCHFNLKCLQHLNIKTTRPNTVYHEINGLMLLPVDKRKIILSLKHCIMHFKYNGLKHVYDKAPKKK